MLLKHRQPGIDSSPVTLRPGLEHLEAPSAAVLRWLNANKVDYVLVGPVAHAIRGDRDARGPVAIVPAPYSRNYERLTRALVAERAGLRSDRRLTGSGAAPDVVTVKLTAEKLARGRRWMLRFGGYDLDLEGAGRRAAGSESSDGSAAPAEAAPSSAAVDGAPPPATSGPRYQELLYEAHRFTLADNLSVEVASPEDLEHFSHLRRTGTAPEFKVIRKVAGGSAADPGSGDGESDEGDSPPASPPAVAADGAVVQGQSPAPSPDSASTEAPAAEAPDGDPLAAEALAAEPAAEPGAAPARADGQEPAASSGPTES
jgi:hypothetical protein